MEITITIDGKTYKPKGELNSINMLNFLIDYISLGYLEEVKENKDHSIIEKLREWEQEERHDALSPLVIGLLDRLSVLLTSLEQPKEEPQPQEDIELLPEYKNQNTYDPDSPHSVEMHELTTQV